MQRSGTADLALYGGGIPPWLFKRMKALALPVVEAIVLKHGKEGFIARLSDPFWFQSFGAAIGMDWNSSGVTTAVMRALKEAITPASHELGIYVCGGKGKESLRTPKELIQLGDKTGLDGMVLAKASQLSAKVDNTAFQDGFNLYLHSFVASSDGQWAVIQQGMHTQNSKARRYHWHSEDVTSFTDEPHTAICGLNEAQVLNLVDKNAQPTQQGILEITKEHPDKILKEIPHLLVPGYCDVKAKDIDFKRLGSILWLSQEAEQQSFEDLLLLKGLGPKTLRSLTLVSEVIHGTPSRFKDPARFSFAHGSKNARPFPVLTDTYDETISTLKSAVEKARVGETDKLTALEKLTKLAQRAEQHFEPDGDFDALLKKERAEAKQYGGRSVQKQSGKSGASQQLNLFDE